MIFEAFQSLLSQGISLLRERRTTRTSTPTASFNPFLVRASVYCIGYGARLVGFYTMFQSLLSQGISLLTLQTSSMREEIILFQSLLSQGISLL